MSERPDKPPIIVSIDETLDGIDIKEDSSFLIVSSSSSESCLASGILCKGLIRSNCRFHLTFVEPIVSSNTLSKLILSYPHLYPIVIGVSTVDDTPLALSDRSLISVGGTPNNSSDLINCINLADSDLGCASYMIIRNHFIAKEEDLALAAISSLLRTGNPSESSICAGEAVDIALELGLVSKNKELRVYGVNFLPLKEIFLKSIHPYIQGISGNQIAVEKLFDGADISFSHRTEPLMRLNNDQIRNLSSELLPHVNLDIIPLVSGTDYKILSEKEESPMYRLSAIQALSIISWANSHPGLLTGVWIGDRARLLRELLDLYSDQAIKVIDTVRDLALKSKDFDANEIGSISIIELNETSSVLSLVGTIALQNSFIDSDRILVFDSSIELVVIWPPSLLEFRHIVSEVAKAGLEYKTLSYRSIAISKKTPESKTQVLSILTELSE
ncbi:MAG: hypothetical protein GF411_05405 [Candidatus Lokiarchaeota archaeon]|nr:hypothetical protein [Candidatus Lokiarchaeota archaeon]